MTALFKGLSFNIMPRKKVQKLTAKEVEKLLDRQTAVILSAVDQKITSLEKRINKMEIRINEKIDRFLLQP